MEVDTFAWSDHSSVLPIMSVLLKDLTESQSYSASFS